jgi:protein gp37
MSDKSAIEWTDATWNPTTGCDRVSPGCANCYALDLAARLKRMGSPAYQQDGEPGLSGPGFALTLHPARLMLPLHWSRPRRVFVDSMSDLFHPAVPVEYVTKVFAAMALGERHTFQVLTKRPERMHAWMTDRDGPAESVRAAMFALDANRTRSADQMFTWPLSNVWLGTSVENARWRTRIDELRQTPAVVRFLSCEPLLGPLHELDLDGIGWVIVGGESGPHHRPIRYEWITGIRDQCKEAGVPFFFKQWGGPTSKSGGRLLDGKAYDGFPRDDRNLIAVAG